MKAKTCVALLILGLFSQNSLKGMSNNPSTMQSPLASVATPYKFAKVIVRTTDGKSYGGLLAGVENDSLTLKKGTSEEKFSCRQISEVRIESGKHTDSFMASGMVLGIYLGNMIFFRAGGQPFAYLDEEAHSEAGSILMDLFFASAGIGLGYLVSMFENGETLFRFGSEAADRLEEWERFKSFLAGHPRNKKIHLSVQAAQVFTSVYDRYRDALADAHEYARAVSRFNLLRKALLTYSLQPKIEVGAAVVFSGEPAVYGFGYGFSGHYDVWQTYEAVGCYAVALYKPFSGTLPETVQWNVGLGLGASRIDFELGISAFGYYPDFQQNWTKHKLIQTVPSGLAFTELRYFIGANISLGLIADYVFGPAKSIPGFPDWDIPSQKIRLGNGSLGATLGLHF